MQLGLANAGTRSPTEFIDELRSTGKVADAEGRSETIGGFPAWVGRIAVPGENGAQRVLVAALIRTSPDRMLQALGQTSAVGDADEQKILESIRSLRPLTDPARLHPEPRRVRVATLAANTTFEEAVKSLEPSTKDVEEVAILNNATADQAMRKGQRIKVLHTGPRATPR